MARMSKMMKEMMDTPVVEKEQEVIREDAPKEVPVETPYHNRTLAMDDEFRIISMTNAVKILPPNMIVDGRHKKENIQAICGFVVTDEMMDKVYANYTHEDYTR